MGTGKSFFAWKNFREENASEMTAASQTNIAQKDAPALVKKSGKTSYIIQVYFRETSRETMIDKIKRMLKNKIRQVWEDST